MMDIADPMQLNLVVGIVNLRHVLIVQSDKSYNCVDCGHFQGFFIGCAEATYRDGKQW